MNVTPIIKRTVSFLVALFPLAAAAQLLPGFTANGSIDEQECSRQDQSANVMISIIAPVQFHKAGTTYLVIYALPNGNSIEWTKGRKMKAGDDWHLDIQHIAAQTRYVRAIDKKNNYIVAYVMAGQKSWPAWKRSTPDSIYIIKKIVDSIAGLFGNYHPKLVLNSHSGGGSFIFGYLDAVETIPSTIERICFLDSDYGYEEEKHQNKLTRWLQQNREHKLLVLAYNDSLVIYNGKPLVSSTGGTWYRSRLMQRNLAGHFAFTESPDSSLIRYTALNGRIQIILKQNPGGLIYHTEQVARNGFILSLLSATRFDRKKYFTYFGNRVYEKFIND
ncbi:MAG TPA: hypothetical protein PLZ45_14065 [Ferruginibacter sp.]|nr:hypothetical protein [Ferruginibacter sp.]